MMKCILTIGLLTNLLCNAQTIENNYIDFELISNAKSVKEYNISSTAADKSIDFENLEKLVSNPTTKFRITNEYSFNNDGFITERKEYFTNPKVFHQEVYSYDNANLLTEITVKECPIDTLNYVDYSKIKITRNGNEVLKTLKYAKVDTIYSEKFILENNHIIEEKAPNSQTLRAKYQNQYDKNYNELGGTIILVSGEILSWENRYTYYPDGNIKSKECLWPDLKTKTTETYYPNGLLKTKVSKDEILQYVYKYDKNGNWIYKMIYKNSKPTKLRKRELVYF